MDRMLQIWFLNLVVTNRRASHENTTSVRPGTASSAMPGKPAPDTTTTMAWSWCLCMSERIGQLAFPGPHPLSKVSISSPCILEPLRRGPNVEAQCSVVIRENKLSTSEAIIQSGTGALKLCAHACGHTAVFSAGQREV